jgi:bifunctional UDP-N-acetylglucosamine pyrophosphorylase/glucosamine-1-phosphate N-acetyltransferase
MTSGTESDEELDPNRRLRDFVQLEDVRIIDPRARSASLARAPIVFVSLDAGRGTRFAASGGSTSKLLAPLRGVPVGVWAKRSIDEELGWPVIAIVGHQRDEIVETYERYAVDGWIYPVSPRSTGGTGYALYHAAAVAGLANSDALIVATVGDRPLYDAGLFSSAIATHRGEGAALTIGVIQYDAPRALSGKGRVVRNADGGVVGLIESRDIAAIAPGELRFGLDRAAIEAQREVNASVYVARASLLFDALGATTPANTQRQYYVTDIVESLAARGRVATFAIPEDRLADVTTLADLRVLEGGTSRGHAR